MHANWCFQSKCSNISAEGLHFSAFHSLGSCVGDVLQAVKEKDISEDLVKKFDEEKYESFSLSLSHSL